MFLNSSFVYHYFISNLFNMSHAISVSDFCHLINTVTFRSIDSYPRRIVSSHRNQISLCYG